MWNRGDGEPDRELLAKAVAAVRRHCEPTRIVLFGSAARGELTDASDVDLLVVVPEAPSEPGRVVASEIEDEIGYDDRADVLVATEASVAEAAGTLAGILRTAAEEGVTVFEAGSAIPYRPRARPDPADEPPVSPERARAEAVRLLDAAGRFLDRAVRRDEGSRRRGHEREGWERTEIAGAARKAVEFALQAVIVAAGRRPRAWRSPAGLAAEAAALGACVPETAPGALERAAEHYTGVAYPDPEYPAPGEAETVTALVTARSMVPWAEDFLGLPPQATGTG